MIEKPTIKMYLIQFNIVFLPDSNIKIHKQKQMI